MYKKVIATITNPGTYIMPVIYIYQVEAQCALYCLSVCLSICPFVYLPASLSVSLSLLHFLSPSLYLSLESMLAIVLYGRAIIRCTMEGVELKLIPTTGVLRRTRARNPATSFTFESIPSISHPIITSRGVYCCQLVSCASLPNSVLKVVSTRI